MKFQCIKNVYRIKILFKAYIYYCDGGPSVSHSPGASEVLMWPWRHVGSRDYEHGLLKRFDIVKLITPMLLSYLRN